VNQDNINSDLCVNIYTFAADEQEVDCCSCLVTPNALWSASVKTALLNSTLTSLFPNEVAIKMISTVPNVGASGAESCNPATVNPNGFNLSPGLLAWGTTLHGVPTATGPAFARTETRLLRELCPRLSLLGTCKSASSSRSSAAANSASARVAAMPVWERLRSKARGA